MQEQSDFKTSAMTEGQKEQPSHVTPRLLLRLWPDPILNKKCEQVTDFNDEIGQIVVAMMKLMYSADGIGLAAPQAGINKRIIVYRVEDEEGYLINPEITLKSEEKQVIKEGCLSFPGVMIGVERHQHVTVKYQDAAGEQQIMKASGLLAQMVQHEVDHLDGVVFTRYLSHLKRDVVNRKMKKIKKALEKKKEIYERLADAQRRDTGDYDFSIRGEQV